MVEYNFPTTIRPKNGDLKAWKFTKENKNMVLHDIMDMCGTGSCFADFDPDDKTPVLRVYVRVKNIEIPFITKYGSWIVVDPYQKQIVGVYDEKQLNAIYEEV